MNQNEELVKPLFYLSKYNWKPGMKGSLIAFSIGDKAIFRTKEKAYDVIIRSELMKHKDSNELVRELEFLDSPEGPGLFAVNADQIEPKL